MSRKTMFVSAVALVLLGLIASGCGAPVSGTNSTLGNLLSLAKVGDGDGEVADDAGGVQAGPGDVGDGDGEVADDANGAQPDQGDGDGELPDDGGKTQSGSGG